MLGRHPNNPLIEEEMVVWSGYDSVYRCWATIKFHNADGVLSNSGCACPREAIEFLTLIGMTPSASDTYDTGYKVPGGWYIDCHKREEDILPVDPVIYRSLNNRQLKNLLHLT